jgi:hypothetical protein
MRKNKMDKFVRIKKSLGRLLYWLDRARSRDLARPILGQFYVGDYFGEGSVVTADGFRLHIVKGLNKREKEEDDVKPPAPGELDDFDEFLYVDSGMYSFRTNIQVANHINEMVRREGNFPDASAIPPSKMKGMKPVAVVALNPTYLRDAVTHADGTVVIRIFANESEVTQGKVKFGGPVEVLSVDKETKLERMAVIMPMHLGWNYRDDRFAKAWPIAWTGKFPKKEEVKDDGNKNDS